MTTTTAEAQQSPSTEEIIDRVLKEYGWSSVDEMKSSKEWAREFQKTKNKGAALRNLARNRVIEGVEVNGWFLKDEIFSDFNQETRQFVETGRGPRILTETGEVAAYAIGKHLEVAPMTPVVLGPVTIRKNLETNETRIVTAKSKTPIRVEQHGTPVPSLDLADEIKFAYSLRNPKNPSNPTPKQRGTVRCIAGEYNPVYATLTIGDWDEVAFFGPNQFSDTGSLRVTARDARGNVVDLPLDLEQVRNEFNITGDDRNAFKAALEGQQVFVGGQLKVAQRFTLHGDFSAFDSDAQRKEAEAMLEKLEQRGYIKAGYAKKKKPDGTYYQLRALNLLSVPENERAVEIAGHRFLDIVEEKPGEWAFFKDVAELNKNPKFDAIERSGTKYYSDGRDPFEWVMNEGAFVTFLATAGFVAESENDPYQDAADLL